MAAVAIRVFLLQSLHFLYSPGDAITIPITNRKFVRDCVDEHNLHRSSVNPGATNVYFMSWDAGLARTARAWSKTCKFTNNPYLQTKGKGHPSFETVGENIYATSGHFSLKEAIKKWNDERIHYNYERNECRRGENCEHYTQLAWGLTYKLGCAVNDCPNGIVGSKITKGTVFVCNYSPSGNRKGELPYIEGPACTDCGADFCRSNLCSDPDRETINQYPKWNPDFGSASILLSNCLLPLMSITVTYILW